MRGADLSELEALYRSRYRFFLRVAWLVAGSEEDAREAVQEGFASVLRARESFRGEGSLEGWVWRSVLNAARMQRRARREPTFLELEQVGLANGDAAEARVVRAWIATLPERQRLAIFLRYYADLDYRTIAEVLEVELGTVSATLSSAHAAMRKAFEEVPT